jgi:lipopolysaccharide biosynthesis glycosyltransferase
MNTNAIVSLVDNHTALDYVVMIQSLRDTNPQLYDTVDKHMFTFGSLCDENRSVIQSLFPTIQETVISPSSDKISYRGNREWGQNPSTVYQPHYRYEIFNLSDYDNLVYLDTDLLIQGNIEKLFTTPAGKIRASKKWPQPTLERDLLPRYTIEMEVVIRQRNLDDSLESFNGGVLSFGEGVSTLDTKSQLLKLQKTKTTPGNQQILNMYFKDRVDFNPQTYNFSTEFYSNKIFRIRPILDDQHIIHFVGSAKPSHALIPNNRRMEDMVLYFSDPENSLFRKIEKNAISNSRTIVKLGFGDSQQDLAGEDGCFELWLRWFKALESTGIFIRPRKDTIHSTRGVQRL